MSDESSLLGLQIAAFSLSSHGLSSVYKSGGRTLSLVSLLKRTLILSDQASTLLTLFNFNPVC